MAIFDSVVEFLRSIGCQLTWSCCHDGSDIDFEYGIHINSITYKGENYEHNPCYNVRYEFPPELLEKLDAKFAVSADVQAPHNRDGETTMSFDGILCDRFRQELDDLIKQVLRGIPTASTSPTSCCAAVRELKGVLAARMTAAMKRSGK